MRIYIAHSIDFDYLNELYLPIKESDFYQEHEVILPHDNSDSAHDRDFYKDIDLFIAEVSYPSTGLGIELGYAYDDDKPICCIHRSDHKVSGSLYSVTEEIYPYYSPVDMLELIRSVIKKHTRKIQ